MCIFVARGEDATLQNFLNSGCCLQLLNSLKKWSECETIMK